ncbi:hypothetical protein D6D00_03503 [Aureobasidium pullulans]|nr:hypothetical protein D6D00_03503 [Aureobasidium pullulans]
MATALSENEIRQITLNGANLVPRQVQDKNNLQQEVTKVIDLFHRIFSTLRTDITNQHRTAACNLLSTLIEKCAQSTEQDIQLLLWQTQKFWAEAFWLYLDQHHALNVKPSRLLLTSITSVLAKCQDKVICEPEKARSLELLVRYIATPSENAPTRPAMQALAHWLSKNIVNLEETCDVFAKVLNLGSKTTSTSLVHDLLQIILRRAPYEDFASSAGSLAALIIQKDPSTSQSSSKLQFGSFQISLWASTVLEVLKQDPRSLGNFRHYVFPEIFQQDKASFISFLEQLGIQSILGNDQASVVALPLPRSQCEEVLFCALSVGSKLGLVKVADVDQHATAELSFEKDVLCIPDVLLGALLLRTSDATRIAGLSMLTTSTTTTQPLSAGAMDALRKGLPFLHADADAGFRSELFSLIKNLVDRIKAATATLAKPSSKMKKTQTRDVVDLPSNTESSELIDTHKSFVGWYLSFLKGELRPTANYQRHVSALRCIYIIATSGVDTGVQRSFFSKSAGPVATWPFTLNVVDTGLADLLVDLLLNPYDDVRSTAAEILSLVETKSQQQNNATEVPVMVKVLAQAEDMMKLSGRADHADGVAHLYGILFTRCSVLIDATGQWWKSQCGILEHLVVTIEEIIRVACADIGKAVNKHPLHGMFISLRYIIERPGFYQMFSSDSAASERLQLLYSRLYSIFGDVWKCVYDTLCNDVLDSVASEDAGEEEVGTKDVLSYAWRALKESSLLLRAIVKNCPLSISDQPLLSLQQLRQLGDLSFTELAELRHRGAFSTVAQTFVICCIRSNSGAETLGENLEDWYQRAVLCIQNQTAINTRRSAGLPSLMIGIVVADSKGALFGRAMKELTIEATRPVDQAAESAGGLSQVHALNCIKDIFKNSRLGERSEAYVPEALSLSAKCLSSDTWAVRNSGLMLFRALMDRLIGTNDAYTDNDQNTQSRLSEEAITSLMHVVLELLGPTDGDVNQVNAEVVFPALQLLQRIQPPEAMAEKIQHSVLRLGSNRQWHVRDKAAKTYATLVPVKDRVSRVTYLVLREARHQNESHGCLLGARYLIERLGKDTTTEDIETLMTTIQSRMSDLLYDNACPFTQAAFVDVQVSFFYAAIKKQRYLFAPGTTWATIEDMNIILDLPQEHFAACAFLRQSLALSLVHEYAVFSGPTNDNSAADGSARVDTFVSLAARDPDACATALREAARIGIADPVYAAQATNLLVNISSRLFDASVDIEVQDAAQEVLKVLFSQGAAEIIKKAIFVDLKKLYLPCSAATPLFSDKRIILQGSLLNLRAEDESLRDGQLTEDFDRWVLQVRNALYDANPFDTRQAAAIATQQLDNKALAYFSSIAGGSVLSFCLAVYDLNNDDDDEIRAIAVPVATNILNAGIGEKHSDMVPLAANQGLANFIASAFGSSDVAAQSALSRATGNAVSSFFPDSVKQSLDNKSKLGSSLFAQEKQNLFIDETREAKIWSSVAAQLHPEAFSFRLLMNLCTWVIDGLDVLIAEIEANPDTPLGWSRKPEVFVLGTQIVYTAELVLKLGKRGFEMPVEGKAVVKRLEALLSKGQENGVNVLWLQTVKEVLEQQK